MTSLPKKKEENFFDNFDDFFARPFLSMRMPRLLEGSVKTPAIEIKDEGKNISASIEMPGVDKNDIKLKVTGNTMMVSAEKKDKKEEKGKNKYYSERTYSSFYRSFTLPAEIDPNKVAAKYDNGVLEVKMEKKKLKQGNEVKVK